MNISPEIQEIKAQIIFRMEENTPRIEKCLAELTETEVWQRPNPASNSVGNLILHLCGNITQYAVSSLGNRPDARDRDAEFAAQEGFSKSELLEKLTSTVKEAVGTIRTANREEMLRVRTVQGFQMSGIGIIVHVCEHYSYHTGQIAFWTKILKNKDLGFYAGIDLTVKNE
jgi:uncharacterized damage-inducible protein DinB